MLAPHSHLPSQEASKPPWPGSFVVVTETGLRQSCASVTQRPALLYPVAFGGLVTPLLLAAPGHLPSVPGALRAPGSPHLTQNQGWPSGGKKGIWSREKGLGHSHPPCPLLWFCRQSLSIRIFVNCKWSGRLRQEGPCQSKVSLGPIMGFSPAWATLCKILSQKQKPNMHLMARSSAAVNPPAPSHGRTESMHPT